jgi:hypothetical protein
VVDAGACDTGGDPADSTEPEIRALARFGYEASLMLETKGVRKLLDEAVFVGQGLEHRVVAPIGTNCVIKDYDPRLIDLETFEIFYKPAEHLFDYLTDHLLANHFFGDDIRLTAFILSSPICICCFPSPSSPAVTRPGRRWWSCWKHRDSSTQTKAASNLGSGSMAVTQATCW